MQRGGNGHTGSRLLPLTDSNRHWGKCHKIKREDKLRAVSWIFSQLLVSISTGISSSGGCWCVLAIHGHWWIHPVGISLNSFPSHVCSDILWQWGAQGLSKTILSGFVLKPCSLLMALCAPRSPPAPGVPVLLLCWPYRGTAASAQGAQGSVHPLQQCRTGSCGCKM